MPGDDDSASALAVDAEVGARWQRGLLGVAVWIGATLVPKAQVLRSRSTEESIDAHVEPWARAIASVDF